MLVWEEEAKPSTAHVASRVPSPASVVHAVRLSVASSADSAAPMSRLRSGPSAPGATTQRVKAADKRIINGRTDVNQLVPFKYKWA